jgi:hypothetical protein
MGLRRALVRLIRLIWLAVRLTIPWLFRGLGVMAWIMSMAAVSIWRGFPEAVERIAHFWLTRSYFPSEWERYAYPVACFGAFLMLVTGWILNAFFTVWLVRWILRI